MTSKERVLLICLLSNLLIAIDRHRYEIINGKAPSAKRLTSDFISRFQNDMRGHFDLAFRHPDLDLRKMTKDKTPSCKLLKITAYVRLVLMRNKPLG